MSSKDAHQGGDLYDMAKDGTKIPNDAGKMNLIPSVPRPDQIEETNNDGLGDPNLQTAADNPIDIARGNKDMGTTGEVISGTGDQMPAGIESKRLHYGANQPAAKGHQRDAKHGKEESDIERFAEDATK
ncbi:hypothetical protein BLS_002896 [Venturia inaequalis]|uniref:Uncharacterized protein n=1 Tax=Venturia inaequalis TaxID=5025 RepID=A0A8H3U116_VENIN|nr:hypothetical protein BLS_002896 [Venturia inaequalis]